MDLPPLVYFSTKSENTHRFVKKLGLPSKRISMFSKDEPLVMDREFILISPSYADNDGKGAVPKAVIRFLNIEENRRLLRGVIASGNRNFGEYFGVAGDVISRKCKVPCLYKFELMGTPQDVVNVKKGVARFWNSLVLEHV